MLTLSEITSNIGEKVIIKDQRRHFKMPLTGIYVIEGFERSRSYLDTDKIETKVVISNLDNTKVRHWVSPVELTLVK